MKETLENTPEYDVIIAGAGPVGLFLAAELALRRCSVLVLERAEQPDSPLKRLPFGLRGLNSLSIDALDRRGLLSALELHKRFNLLPAGARTTTKPGGHFAGLQFQVDNLDPTQWPHRLPGASHTLLISELQELEAVLAARVQALGVTIRRGQAITDFEQTTVAITVRTGTHAFYSRWLVGCDGSRSVVRKQGGFDFAGTEPEFTGYSVQVDIADPEKLQPGRTLTPAGMYWQSQPGYLILQDFDGGAFHQRQQPLTREYVQGLLRRISGTDVTITALYLGTAWTDRARQATAYRRGRVLLAGDAAHIHSPLGGQGLNLGLGDALNLGWKLAAAIHGTAPEGLLDSYCAERYPVGAQVLEWSRAQVALMQPTPGGQALREILRDLLATRDGATYVAGRVWGITTHYDLGSEHPLTGYSVPNFTFADGSTMHELLRDGRGVLLDFDGQASLQTVAESWSRQLKYVAGRANEQAGLRAVLVRPDGVVAWATNDEPDIPAMQLTVARWFGC